MEGYKYNKRKKIGFFFFGLIFLAAIIWVVMFLWNWLMPEVFGLRSISYFQAAGLLLLSKILFGLGWFRRHRQGSSSWHWKQRFMKKWETLSEEERENMKEKWSSRYKNC